MAHFTINGMCFLCVIILFQIILLHNIVTGATPNDCPDEGKAHHGEWSLHNDEDEDSIVCELKCHHGYSPSGCTVLRKDGYGEWNHDVPTCEKESSFSVSWYVCKVAKFAPGYALGSLGFSKVGIVKDSFAAGLMKWLKKVEKGSLFARIQRAAMKGYYPTELIEQICKITASYLSFSSKPDCETPKRKTEL